MVVDRLRKELSGKRWKTAQERGCSRKVEDARAGELDMVECRHSLKGYDGDMEELDAGRAAVGLRFCAGTWSAAWGTDSGVRRGRRAATSSGQQPMNRQCERDERAYVWA